MAEIKKTPDPTRSDLAEDRTILANERTFAGWMRTSLACVAIGVGFYGLFQQLSPAWLPKAVATAFLLLAILIVVLAERRAAAVLRRLDTHVVQSTEIMNLRLFAGVISAGAVALIGATWLLASG